MSVGHLYVLYVEVSIQVLCPFLFVSTLYILDINPLSDVLANMFSHSVGCLFILLMLFLCCEKTFHFEIVPFIYFFSFVYLAWGDIFDKILLWAMSEILLPMFPSRIFMSLGLTFYEFGSLIHFEFILMCCVRRGLVSFFCTYLSNFPDIIYWIHYL